MDVWEQDLQTKSEATRYNYRRYFSKFLERWAIGDGEELYAMRRADLASEDTRDHENVQRMVKVFMAEMFQQGYAAGTCRTVSKAVVSFFESQGLPLRIKAKDKPQGFENGQRMALAENIRKMWDYAPAETRLKTRAQLMFLKDSGIRVSDLAPLNIGDYSEAREVKVNEQRFKAFEARGTEKTGAPAYIHIGPETVQAVDLYLEERGEEDPTKPLFVDRFRKRFRAQTLSMVFYRLGLKAGKNVSGHSLRKFHTTQLQSAGLHDSWIKKLQGKSVGGSMGPYSRPEESGDLTPAYVEAYSKLKVFGEVISAEKMDQQNETIEELRTQLQDYENKFEAIKAEKVKTEDTMAKILRALDKQGIKRE